MSNHYVNFLIFLDESNDFIFQESGHCERQRLLLAASPAGNDDDLSIN